LATECGIPRQPQNDFAVTRAVVLHPLRGGTARPGKFEEFP
jgi:hypothetical protein